MLSIESFTSFQLCSYNVRVDFPDSLDDVYLAMTDDDG